MTPDTPETSPSATEMPAKWVSVAAAAAALGVSARAIQKRAARGTLAARKSERGGAVVWEIDGRELGGGMDANGRTDGRELVREPANLLPQVDANPAPNHAQSGCEPVREMDANGRELGGGMDTNRAAEYRAEIAFLRATIEQLQRDGAETRASLREALKAMPKQLSAGAPETARNAQNEPQNLAAGNGGREASNGPRIVPEREETRLTYGDLADMLEKELGGIT